MNESEICFSCGLPVDEYGRTPYFVIQAVTAGGDPAGPARPACSVTCARKSLAGIQQTPEARAAYEAEAELERAGGASK